MTNTETENLKYPIGKRQYNGKMSPAEFAGCLHDIENLPGKLRKEVENLSPEQLNTPYRPGGWTVRQVVHHFSDSHMNAFIRFKLALSEEQPAIKPYAEAAWAEMPDSISMPVEPGLNLLQALHQRWIVLLKSMNQSDLQRSYVHPQYGKVFTLDEAVGLYAWHCNHHLAHITELKKRNQW